MFQDTSKVFLNFIIFQIFNDLFFILEEMLMSFVLLFLSCCYVFGNQANSVFSPSIQLDQVQSGSIRFNPVQSSQWKKVQKVRGMVSEGYQGTHDRVCVLKRWMPGKGDVLGKISRMRERKVASKYFKATNFASENVNKTPYKV